MYKVTTAKKHDEIWMPSEEVYVECLEDAVKYIKRRKGRKDFESFVSKVDTCDIGLLEVTNERV